MNVLSRVWVLGFVWLVAGQVQAATNKEVLKELFDTGTSPAVQGDFSEVDFETGLVLGKPSNTCVVVDGGDRPYHYNVSRMIRVTAPVGPLLPGKRDEKLVFGDVRLSYDHTGDPVVKGTDLVLTNPIYKTWIDGNSGTMWFVPAKLYARQSGLYVGFRVVVKHTAPGVQDEDYYGYCYPTPDGYTGFALIQ